MEEILAIYNFIDSKINEIAEESCDEFDCGKFAAYMEVIKFINEKYGIKKF